MLMGKFSLFSNGLTGKYTIICFDKPVWIVIYPEIGIVS